MIAALLLTALATPYADALARYNSAGKVDYAGLARSKALDPAVAALATATVPGDKAGAIAFWLNAYNLLTLDLVADHWPLGSIRDLDRGDPWSVPRFVVAGRTLSLNQIEHDILRKMGEPRVHAALNCASRGCPPLPPAPFAAATLDAQLEAAMAAWVQAGAIRVDPIAKKLTLSMIFDWYGADFPAAGPPLPGLPAKAQGPVQALLPHLSAAEAAALRAGGYTVAYAPYDWAVNAR